MILSTRLLAIAKQVNHHDVICDIGTDHGLLPIYLAKANQIIQAYAVDINPLPLQRLKKNLSKYKVDDIIVPVLADGLSWIRDEKIDTCIIAGMGGATIVQILQQNLVNIDRFILAANNGEENIRKWAKKMKFFVENEIIIKDNNLIYEIIVINKKNGTKIKSKKDIMAGAMLRKVKNPLFQEKCLLKINHLSSVLHQIPLNTLKYKQEKKRLKLLNKIYEQAEKQ